MDFKEFNGFQWKTGRLKHGIYGKIGRESLKVVSRILRGYRQGGNWLPSAYKMFINPALDLFEKHQLGFQIDTIHQWAPQHVQMTNFYSLNKIFELMSMYKEIIRTKNKLNDQKNKVMALGADLERGWGVGRVWTLSLAIFKIYISKNNISKFSAISGGGGYVFRQFHTFQKFPARFARLLLYQKYNESTFYVQSIYRSTILLIALEISRSYIVHIHVILHELCRTTTPWHIFQYTLNESVEVWMYVPILFKTDNFLHFYNI